LVLAKNDGVVLNLNSGNHKNLKNRTTEQSPERAC
jgi:hypothetical protein